MAFITDILNTIKNARKGKDMRQAIYDGIQQCYKDAVGHPESVAATVKEIGEVSANLSKETADRKAEVSTERKRIDNLIATGTAQTQEIGKKIIQDSSISSSGIVLKGLTNNNYYYKLFEESGSIDSEFCTITNQQGKYTAKLLKPGLYYMNFKVHVEMSGGFSEEVIAPLKLFKSNTLDWSTFDVLDAETVEISKTENTSINKKIHFLFKITEPSYIRIYIDVDTSHTKAITFRIDGCDITALDWKGKQSADLSELHDLRIGADSTVYGTAGEAVRKQIGNLMKDLDSVDLVLNPSLVENSGHYYNDDKGANIQSDANFCYTDPIEVKKGDEVELVGAGYNTSVSMICLCDANNSHRMSVYYSSNSSVNTYRYTATMDCYLTFSYKQTSKHSLKIYRKSKPIVIDDVVNESPCAIETIKTFIDLNGTLISHPNYCISSLIQLKRNDELKFSISCENAASALSLCDSSGSFVKSLIAGKGQSQMEYSYTATEDCYVKICFRVRYRERTYSAELNHFRYEPIVKMSFSMFEKWGVIGDSFASGVFYDNEMQALDNHLQKSWAQILARESGNKCENFSMGGLYCGSWLSNTARGLPFMLSESAKELYIIALGINDVSKLGNDQPLGTISDMNLDYSQNPYTFYGNYGKIIGNIKTHAPKAKIILSTIPYNEESAMQINNAIISIANHFELPCLMVHADKFFRSEYYWDNFEQDHPKSFMYGATANAYERLICDSLKNDTSYWGDTFN